MLCRQTFTHSQKEREVLLSRSINLSICPIILWTVGAPHDVTTNLHHSSFLCFSHGVAQSQACPFTDVIFPSFSLSAPSSTLHSALEKCLGKARRSCNVPISLQLALFHNGHEFFVGSNGLPDSASSLFVRNVFSV